MKTSKIMRFQSHLPVLESIPKWRKISRVVELGGGIASTHTFRNPAIYTDLTELITYETDREWADYLKGGAAINHHVRRCSWMSDVIERLKSTFQGDLLFVDCNPEGARNLALRELCDNFHLVVLHDAEREEYADAQSVYKHRMVYDKMTPHTTVLSNTVDLRELAAVIALHKGSYEIMDPVRAA